MSTPFTATHDLYIAGAGAGAVDRFEFDAATGRFSDPGESYPAAKVRALAATADGRLLYAGLTTDPPVAQAFTRGPDGALSPLATARLGDSTAYIALAADDSALFSASYHASSVHLLEIDDDGVPVPPPVEAPAVGEKAHSALPSPDGRHVYAASLGSDAVVVYRRAARGLEEVQRVAAPAGSGPRHSRFDPAGRRLYVLHEMSGLVAVYDRDAESGELTERQQISSIPDELGLTPGFAREPGGPTPGPDAIWCADLHFGCAGRFLYTTERSSSTVTGFAVDLGSGELAYAGTWPTQQQPRGAAVVSAEDGDYLLVAGEASATLGAYRLEPSTGAPAETDATRTSEGPLWVTPVAR
ncbi:beta-propeller fold lactonase family protein [Zhihengliuella sp.]|uniref:lactonase family protein n=1 Tax=Zhihengliuella sp. TaxID=1954483 RepID=UPI002811280C|nr:beta-propeller fold lactonase family protein [Zhihengliuella sp.]